MRTVIAILILSAAAFAQPKVNINPCTATRTANCTPQVSSAGAYVPTVPAGSIPTATNVVKGGVTMSTATSSVAVATDDTRLVAAGKTPLPTDGSGANLTGLVAAQMPAVTVTLTATSPITVSTTLNAAYYYNQHATPATAITYTLPTAAAGKQFCFGNSYNGSAADTGALTIATSAAGQYLIDVDGTLGSTGGNVASAGAGGDHACVVGVDGTHWQLYVTKGTWTKN